MLRDGQESIASGGVALFQLDRSAVYRHYVDKCLKKMGMQRLVIQLRDIFNCTLQRAKEALESPRHGAQTDLKRVGASWFSMLLCASTNMV